MCMFGLAAALALAIDPRYATNLTVYHVNEHKFGAVPVNMNTADATGGVHRNAARLRVCACLLVLTHVVSSSIPLQI